MLLDVTETGKVVRVKFLKRPADSEPIAISESFKLQFEPARDTTGKAVPTLDRVADRMAVDVVARRDGDANDADAASREADHVRVPAADLCT